MYVCVCTLIERSHELVAKRSHELVANTCIHQYIYTCIHTCTHAHAHRQTHIHKYIHPETKEIRHYLRNFSNLCSSVNLYSEFGELSVENLCRYGTWKPRRFCTTLGAQNRPTHVIIGVLQCVAVCCSGLQCVAVGCSVLLCVAVCCSVLQCVAVCCSVLQCVAVCCSVLQ